MAVETLARDAGIAFNDMIPGGSAEGEDKLDTRAQQDPDGSLPIRHPTILVVDDEPCVLALVRAVLAPHYRLVTAACGHEALALSFGTEPVMLLLVDVMLGDMLGPEVVRMFRQRHPESAHL